MFVLAWLYFRSFFFLSIFNATVSQMNKAFYTSNCAAPEGYDLNVYRGTSDPTEHLGCMIHVRVAIGCWSFYRYSMRSDILIKSINMLLFLAARSGSVLKACYPFSSFI